MDFRSEKYSKLLSLFSIVVLSVSTTSCGCIKRCPCVNIDTRDSIIVREVVNYVDSTVYYHVRDSVTVNVTRDTTSHLETDMAISDVDVRDGLIYHTLRNKESLQPVSIRIPQRTVTAQRARVITQKVTIPAELSWWQTARIRLGEAFLIVIVLLGLFLLFRAIIK